MPCPPIRRKAHSGQAAVEAALTLPLTVFMLLGAVQLFMMMQGRVLANYAVFRAARAGSLNYCDCKRMTHSALASLLPAFTRTTTPVELGTQFGKVKANAYAYNWMAPYTGAVVWLGRDLDQLSGGSGSTLANAEELFDLPLGGISPGGGAGGDILVVKLVFWFPMKIPFANWVISRTMLAAWGVQTYGAINPLMVTQTANWAAAASKPKNNALVEGEMASRAARQEYVFPIRAYYSMRMMTPPRGPIGPCGGAPANF